MAASTVTAGPTCASCIFGAAQSSLLSFSGHAVETITVDVIPHITVYTNGSRVTSYESLTQTETDVVSSVSGGSSRTTYTNVADITWTVGDTTLTYPTTYLQYLAFSGAATATPSQACVDLDDLSSIQLPATADAASFIYPLALNQTTATALPSALINYLETFPDVSSIFGDVALTGCAPLSGTSTPTSSGQAASSLVSVTTPSPGPTSPGYSIPFTPTSSLRLASCTRNGTVINGTTRGCPSRTVPFVTVEPSAVSVTPSSSPSESDVAPSEVTQATGFGSTIALTEYSSAQITHSTAYIISPVTGRPIITTESSPVRPSPKPPSPPKESVQNNNSPDTAISKSAGPNDPLPLYGLSALNSVIQSLGHQQATDSRGADAISTAGGEGVHPADESTAVYQIPGTVVSAQSDGIIVFGSQTVSPGQSVTLGSGASTTVVAMHTEVGSTQLIVGGSTFDAIQGSSSTGVAPSEALVTANGQTFTAIETGGSIVLVDGSSTTTLPVGSGATFDGQTVSIGVSSKAVVVNGKTTPFSEAPAATQIVVTDGTHTFTAVQLGQSVVFEDGASSVAVKDGSSAQFHGETVYAASSGRAVVVNGKTMSLTRGPGPATVEVTASVDGHTLTAINENGSVLVEEGASTITIMDGSTTFFDGQTISIRPSGSALVVNGETVALTTHSADATTTKISDYITSGLSGPGGPTTASTAAPKSSDQQNNAVSVELPFIMALSGALLGILLLL